jgi:predicted RNase H-like HicB family nuclease
MKTPNDTSHANPSIKLIGALIGDKENGYTGYFKQFPNVIAEGDTIEETRSNLFIALQFYVATLLEIDSEDSARSYHSSDVTSFVTELTLN